MDDMRFLVAMVALFLSAWNYLRLKQLDEKKEYKDKRFLYGECTKECSSLLERITLETEELVVRNSYFDLMNSSYVGSDGFIQARTVYIKNLREIQACKSKVTSVYTGLHELTLLPEKESFDSCIKTQKKIKDIFLKYIENYASAKSQIDGIEKMANYQSKQK